MESKFSKFMIEYLDEIGTESENTLVCLLATWICSNNDKKRGRKTRDTLSLNTR